MIGFIQELPAHSNNTKPGIVWHEEEPRTLSTSIRSDVIVLQVLPHATSSDKDTSRPQNYRRISQEG